MIGWLRIFVRLMPYARHRWFWVAARRWCRFEPPTEPRLALLWLPMLCALRASPALNIFKFCRRGSGIARFDAWRARAGAAPVPIPAAIDRRALWTWAFRCALLATWLALAQQGSDQPGIIIAAIGADTNWYTRAGGAEANGGGFDSTISGAGTNYCDQDAAQLTLTDITTLAAGATTITSIVGGFTSAMIGNCVRIASGTNFQTGYYFITAVADTNNATVDRTPTSGAAGTLGNGKIGGAHAALVNYSNGGSGLATPLITSPLAAGHTINLRGAGTDDPSTADYTHTGGYWQFPGGSSATGGIRLLGYNGRPRVSTAGLWMHNLSYWHVENLKLVAASATNGSFGLINDGGTNGTKLVNLYIDQNGNDISGCIATIVMFSRFTNSGSASAGTYSAITLGNYGGQCAGNWIKGWRGSGINQSGNQITAILFNVIISCKLRGIDLTTAGAAYGTTVLFNTIYSCTSDGIKASVAQAIDHGAIRNNVLVSNGGYGINFSVGTTALNNRRTRGLCDYNAFYNNTSGARNAHSAGAHDVTLTGDPFTNAAGDDFSLNGTAGAGAALKATGFPGTFPAGTTVGYTDVGAVQVQASAGGGLLTHPGMAGGMRG